MHIIPLMMFATTLGILCFVFVMFFGDAEIFEKTPIAKLHDKIQDLSEFWLSERFQMFMQRIVGRTCCLRLWHVQEYVCFKPNPILPIFYLFLVTAGFLVFVSFAFPYIPFMPEKEWGIHWYHKPNSFIVVASCLFLFFKCCFTDPGEINDDNVEKENERYVMDHLIYHPRECNTCILVRPARSKHCSICDRCVARFDHHCPWINNCVGVHNTRWFILFLLMHAVLCVYGGVLLGFMLRALIISSEIYSMFVRDPVKGVIPVSHSHVFRWTIQQYGPLAGLCFGLSAIGLVLTGFVAYHIYLAGSNMTTNESYKWKDLKRAIKRRQLKQLKEEGEITEEDPLVFAYSQGGFFANVFDVFFPSAKPRQVRRKNRANKGKNKAAGGATATGDSAAKARGGGSAEQDGKTPHDQGGGEGEKKKAGGKEGKKKKR